MKVKVRTSRESDLPDIWALGLEYCEEVGQPYYRDWLYQSIKDRLSSCMVAEIDGNIVGMMMYSDLPDPWTGELRRWETHWYVSKYYRRYMVGLHLLARVSPDYIVLPYQHKAPKGFKPVHTVYAKE